MMWWIFFEDEFDLNVECVSFELFDIGFICFIVYVLLFLELLLSEGGGLFFGGEFYFYLNKVFNLYVVYLIVNKCYVLVLVYVVYLRYFLLIEMYVNFLDFLVFVVFFRKMLCYVEAAFWMEIEGSGGWWEIVMRVLSDFMSFVNVYWGFEYWCLMF